MAIELTKEQWETILSDLSYLQEYALSFSHIEDIDADNPDLFNFAYATYSLVNNMLYLLKEEPDNVLF